MAQNWVPKGSHFFFCFRWKIWEASSQVSLIVCFSNNPHMEWPSLENCEGWLFEKGITFPTFVLKKVVFSSPSAFRVTNSCRSQAARHRFWENLMYKIDKLQSCFSKLYLRARIAGGELQGRGRVFMHMAHGIFYLFWGWNWLTSCKFIKVTFDNSGVIQFHFSTSL